MNSAFLFSSPTFSNLEFKYFGKSYYANREIVQLQSDLIIENQELKVIILPSIKGQIKELLNYLCGNSVPITRSNAFFFDIMSSFMKFKDEKVQKAVKKLLPNIPTLEMVFQFFQSQKDISFDFNSERYKPYLKILKKYFMNYQDAYISYLSVNYILQNNFSLDLPSTKKILHCLLSVLKTAEYQSYKYNEIEKTILEFVNQYPITDLYEILLLCPFFDIKKVTKFREILSKPPKISKYPDESGKGFFQSHLDDDDFEYSIQTSSHNFSRTTENCFNIKDDSNPSFIIKFENFKFNIISYCFKAFKNSHFPIRWSLYASKDFENYILIHHCENKLKFDGNECKVFNFKVDKFVDFAQSVKFVLFESFKIDENEKKSLEIDNFDIFGSLHHSFSSLSDSFVFDDDDDSIFEETSSDFPTSDLNDCDYYENDSSITDDDLTYSDS